MKINVDFIYPIGSVYITTQAINPSILFGGNWVQTCKSRALAGAGSNIANTDSNYGAYAAGTLNLQAGNLLGEPTHKLTVNEMPAHKHWSQDIAPGLYAGWGNKSQDGWITPSTQSKNGGNWETASTGGGQAHNNIMPIEVYYIWKRVS
jgi:microcystin-dependent protein